MIETNAKKISIALLGEPNEKLSKETELRWGTFGSLSVDLEKGTYFNHEEQTGGGMVELIRSTGKDPKEFLDEMGLNEKFEVQTNGTKVTARYLYKDADNKPSYEVIRYEPKTFRQRRFDCETNKFVPNLKNVTPLPYNLPEIIKNQKSPIYICEGEKDADHLNKLGLLATCNSGGAGNWSPALNKYFAGRKIIILPDNDDAGVKHSQLVASQLQSIADSIKIVPLPVPDKGDPYDFFQQGGTVSDLKQKIKETPQITEIITEPQLFKAWEVTDPLTIKPRDFIYRNFCRGFMTLTVAQGGVGKSILSLSQAIACVTQRDFLGFMPKKKCKVVYYNSEDPTDELNRRCLAIMQHWGISQEEVAGRLYLASGRDSDLILCQGADSSLQEPNFDKIERFCLDNEIDILILDPLVNMLGGSNETNETYALVSKRLSQLAEKCNLCVELVHHTRKVSGREMSIEDSRGGISLVSASRSASYLAQMDKDTGLKYNLDHYNYFSVNDGKNNLKPIDKQFWYEKVPVNLTNGDVCAVVIPYKFPDAFEGVTRENARSVQLKVDEANPPYKAHYSASNYIGKLIAEILDINFEDKAVKTRVNQIFKTWVDNDVLKIEEEHDSRNGRSVKFVRSGKNNPMVVQ